jgi:hypothetical protein
MQLVPITTEVVSANPTHGEVYSIQYYVIKFVELISQKKFTENIIIHNCHIHVSTMFISTNKVHVMVF